MTTEIVAVKKDPSIQGAHILKSYLNALGIPHAAGAKHSEVVVTTKAGSTLKVTVGEVGGQVEINPADISSAELERSLAALFTVTEAAGYGSPQPVSRGATATGRVNYIDNFEDVYLRHSIFRRSPNKTPAELAPYMDTIRRSAKRANYRWKSVFSSMGFNEGDLMTVGMVYAISFLHHYASAVDHIDNIKLLTDFLKQRFGEMAKITYKKALNATCLPQAVVMNSFAQGDDETGSYIDTYAEAEEASADEEYGEETFVLTYSNGTERVLRVESDGNVGLDMYLDGRLLGRTEAKALTDDLRSGRIQKRGAGSKEVVVEETEESVHLRRQRAREELESQLLALTPERRTVLLGYAALSRDYAPDARREARKLAEKLVCPTCKKTVPSGSICQACEVPAVPLFGVDFKAFKERLQAENHPMAEAMSAQIPESEARAAAKKPVLLGQITALADTLSAEDIKPARQVKGREDSATQKANKALAAKMAEELMAKLPDTMECPACKVVLPKERFGIRVAKDKSTGLPARASRQSYCKGCRRNT